MADRRHDASDGLESITGISVGKSMKILAGFVMEQLGHIPAVGESFTYRSYRFEVVDMDINRIDKVLIQNIQNAAESQSSD